MVTVTATGLSTRSYWQPRRKVVTRKPEEYSDALRELLDQAVKCRLRGAQGKVGSDLSGGLDSGAVATTAARLLAPSQGLVVAFTAVPRQGYADSPAAGNRLVDEGPYAAATAALYPNIEHVLIRSENRSPLDALDRNFFLFDTPCPNPCNSVWGNSINDAARQRKLKVVFNGAAGNFGLGYDGMELLPELLRTGRLFHLWREMRALVAKGRLRWRGALANTFGAWCPPAIWIALNRIVIGGDWDVTRYAAIRRRRFIELDLRTRARNCALDFAYRPWKDGFSMRLWALRRGDPGNYNKGVLGGWRIDGRDPTADLRLLEFCLTVPTEEFLSKGIPRALARRVLADRLPKTVLENMQRGVQTADWHERLTAVRDRVALELDQIAACPVAAKILDMPHLHRLVDNWPTDCWQSAEVNFPYRYTLLRAIAAGHFLRRTTRAN